METVKLEINKQNAESLEAFSQFLQKDASTILNEALEQYFENVQQKIHDEALEGEQANTNLEYDEFWDGVDLDG
jgi:predicted DNA-binding protein